MDAQISRLFEIFVRAGHELYLVGGAVRDHLLGRPVTEVDWVVVTENRWLPVEVKWSEAPTERDTRHLQTFLSEYPKAREGVVVCRTPRRFKITPRITAIHWQEIHSLVKM